MFRYNHATIMAGPICAPTKPFMPLIIGSPLYKGRIRLCPLTFAFISGVQLLLRLLTGILHGSLGAHSHLLSFFFTKIEFTNSIYINVINSRGCLGCHGTQHTWKEGQEEEEVNKQNCKEEVPQHENSLASTFWFGKEFPTWKVGQEDALK
jgi:hypothetical protein